MHSGISHKYYTLINLRVNISVNLDFQSAVLHHSEKSVLVPQVLSAQCWKDQNTGGRRCSEELCRTGEGKVN